MNRQSDNRLVAACQAIGVRSRQTPTDGFAPTGDVKRVNLERRLSVPIPDIVLDMYATAIAAVREAFASIMTAGGKNASSRRGRG